jgi:uroporphyrinogen-III synthase
MHDGLRGKVVVNTRAAHQAADLDALLRAYGAEPVAYPCIAIGPPDDVAALDAILKRALQGDFDWLILTSTNTVLALAERLQAMGVPPTILQDVTSLKIATVGPQTAESAADLLGLTVNLVPESYVAEGLAAALREQSATENAAIWLPQSAIAKPDLGNELRGIAREIVVVDAYETVLGSGGVNLGEWLPCIHAITFTSGSTVRNFLTRIRQEGITLDSISPTVIACIGPKTAKTAMQNALDVAVVPDEYTLDGMVAALAAYFGEPSR